MPLSQTLRKNSHVLWTISVIQDQNPDAQTKSEFSEMTSDVLNTDTIDTVTLCLADNLQRFRLMIQHDISEEEAILECQKMASTWHQDNFDTIEKLKENKNLSLLTWEEFLVWPDRQKIISDVEVLYKENKDFRHSFDGRIRQAAENISPHAKISDPTKQTELLKRYLFEECAFQKFAASKGFDYELYKTAPSQAIRKIKNNTDYVPHGYMDAIHFTQFNVLQKKKNINVKSTFFSSDDNNKPINFASIRENKNHLSHQKVATFVESSLYMLPIQYHEKAIELLVKCITQEILPLCYPINQNIIK